MPVARRADDRVDAVRGARDQCRHRFRAGEHEAEGGDGYADLEEIRLLEIVVDVRRDDGEGGECDGPRDARGRGRASRRFAQDAEASRAEPRRPRRLGETARDRRGDARHQCRRGVGKAEVDRGEQSADHRCGAGAERGERLAEALVPRVVAEPRVCLQGIVEQRRVGARAKRRRSREQGLGGPRGRHGRPRQQERRACEHDGRAPDEAGPAGVAVREGAEGEVEHGAEARAVRLEREDHARREPDVTLVEDEEDGVEEDARRSRLVEQVGSEETALHVRLILHRATRAPALARGSGAVEQVGIEDGRRTRVFRSVRTSRGARGHRDGEKQGQQPPARGRGHPSQRAHRLSVRRYRRLRR